MGKNFIYTYAWNFAKYLYLYFLKTKYSDGTGWYNVDEKTTTYIKSIVKSMARFVEKGDIMFYSSSYEHHDIYHAVIVTEVTKTDVKISAHSNPRKNESLIELLKNKSIVSIFAISIRKKAV